ncbi:MAG: hypothetical protein ACRECD_01110 [Burkholderiaceae bacterium]
MTTQANIKITAEDKTAAAFASVSRQFDQLGFNANTLKSSIGGALAALAVPVSAGAIAALVVQSSKAIDEFNDLADATGASIENISALDRVARETGGSFDTAASALLKFNKILNDSEEDGKRAAAILKALGLNANELKQLDPAEAMRRLAVAFSTFADDGAKGRAILELTGKSAREIAPFLKDLSEKSSLVATTSTQAAEEAEKFNKQLYQLKANAEDFARSLTVDVVTALNETIAKFREGQKEGKGFLQIAAERYWQNVRSFYGMAPEVGGGRGFVNPAAVDPTAPRAALEIPDDPARKKTGSPKGGAAKDPLAEAKRYLENLQRQLEKTRELGIEEQTLAEIQSGRMGLVNPALEQQLLATARLIDLKKAEKDSEKASEKAAKEAADAAGKLFEESERFAREVETPYEKLQRQLEELARTAQSNPLISAETAERMGTKHWQEYLESLEEVNKEVNQFDEFNKRAAQNIQDALGQGLFDLMEGNFQNIGKGFTSMINRMVAEAAAANIARELFGDLVPGGTGKGMAGGLLDSFGKALLGGGGAPKTGGDFARMDRGQSSAGGGGGLISSIGSWFGSLMSFDVGTDYVPQDMVAKIHKGERIIPAAQNKPGFGGNTVNLTIQQSFAPGTNRQTTLQAAADARRQLEHAGRNL